MNKNKTFNIDVPLRDINKNELDLNERMNQEIKECNELRSIHKNLMKNLEDITMLLEIPPRIFKISFFNEIYSDILLILFKINFL